MYSLSILVYNRPINKFLTPIIQWGQMAHSAQEQAMSGLEALVAKVAEAAEAEAKAAPISSLCKGAMPMPLVWYIKFHESHENKSAVAKRYHTTVGKITDIQKGNNQKYIVERMVWGDEELVKAEDTIRANFVRGQDKDGVSKRQLATTTIEDADYSLEVIQLIRDMELDGDTLTEARATFLEANPRAKRARKEEVEDGENEEVIMEDGENEEDLLD